MDEAAKVRIHAKTIYASLILRAYGNDSYCFGCGGYGTLEAYELHCTGHVDTTAWLLVGGSLGVPRREDRLWGE